MVARGRPRGLAFALLILRAALSLTGKFARFITRLMSSSFQANTAGSACDENCLFALHFSVTVPSVMANRKLGCLTLFLFLALCASALVNIFLVFGLIGRFSTGFVREEVPPRFRELMVQAGARASSDRIAVILCAG